MIKDVEDLSPSDLGKFPIWEFVNDDAIGETAVQPVECIPTDSLNNRVVVTPVCLANGNVLPALLGSIDVCDSRRTHHFLTLTIFKNGQRFLLARYHDFNYDKHGPVALANFLGLKTDEVFPIAYDVREYCSGDFGALVGTIESQPREILTQAEIISLAAN